MTDLTQTTTNPNNGEQILDRGFETRDVGEDNPEFEPNAPDLGPTTVAHHDISLAYRAKAREAGLLDDGVVKNARFFSKERNYPSLISPATNTLADTTPERDALYEHYKRDRIAETGAEKPENVKAMAEVSLTQAFADMVQFKKSVIGKLQAIGSDGSLAEAFKKNDGSGTYAAMLMARDQIYESAAAYVKFEQYADLTKKLMEAYRRQFPADADSFIKLLNDELYMLVEKKTDPAKEDGKYVEFVGVLETAIDGISFTELLDLADSAVNEARQALGTADTSESLTETQDEDHDQNQGEVSDEPATSEGLSPASGAVEPQGDMQPVPTQKTQGSSAIEKFRQVFSNLGAGEQKAPVAAQPDQGQPDAEEVMKESVDEPEPVQNR